MSRKPTWTIKELQAAVLDSKSFRDLVKKLNLKSGASFIKRKCIEANIDTSHFEIKPSKGNSNYYQYIDKDINFLHILDVIKRYNKETSKYEYKFLCECLKCHSTKNKKLCTQVLQGKIKTCGCKKDMYAKTRGSANYNWTGFGEISGTWMKKLRKSAKVRNYQLDVDIQYLWELFLKQDKKCAYTNLDLVFGVVDDKQTKTASLDRIDNSKGYIKGNVQWVHKTVNIMKHKLGHLEFIEFCKLVSRNFENVS